MSAAWRDRLLAGVLIVWAVAPAIIIGADAARRLAPREADAAALASEPWPDEVCEGCGAAGAAISALCMLEG